MPAVILENPVSKELIVVHPAEPGVFRIEEQVPIDMIRPPVHIHRAQHERFEVLHGEVTVQVRKERHVLAVGDSLVVQPGIPHTWWNSGEGELRMLTEFRPPGNMQSFFETFCGIAQEGRADAKGGPPFLQIVASASHWDSYLGGPPVAIQRALFAILGPLARLRGYRASYDRFRSQQPVTGAIELPSASTA
jgi:mannose-6-phosphate isomerase-like protein (cupin superfamily)